MRQAVEKQSPVTQAIVLKTGTAPREEPSVSLAVPLVTGAVPREEPGVTPPVPLSTGRQATRQEPISTQEESYVSHTIPQGIRIPPVASAAEQLKAGGVGF